MPPRKRSATPATSEAADYRHDATRLNNPPAGLADVNPLPPAKQRTYQYDPRLDPQLHWAGKAAHPAQEIPFADLIRLPELFPCRFTLSVDDLRRNERFEVQRQGMGWDMVRLLHLPELG